MQYTAKIERAFLRASIVHAHMKRKADESPYITHPIAVAWILSNYTEQDDIVCAGILHDTVEDSREEAVPYTFEMMEEEFGLQITNMVRNVTEADLPGSKRETWLTRKENYIQHLETADEGSLMVSCADKLHNLQCMMEAFQKQGEPVWEKFNHTPEKKLWFFGEVLRILQKRLQNPIVQELDAVYQKALVLFA